MKAKELQIGDWVQVVESCKYAGAIGCIKTLIDHKYDESAYFKVFLRSNTIHIGIEDICSDDIRPIPLTPEILEKNGFTKLEDESGKQRYRWEYADGIHISIDFTDTDPWVHVSNRCYFAVPYCEYVHQLQHALRLCGIEKEIEL